MILAAKERGTLNSYTYKVSPRMFKEIHNQHFHHEKLSRERKDELIIEGRKYRKNLFDKYNGKIELNYLYYNRHTPHAHKCNNCDLEWFARPLQILKSEANSPCPNCFKHKMQLTHKIYLQRLKSTNSNIICVDEYTCQYDKVTHECQICGYIWKVKPKNLLNGSGCPDCYLANRKIRNSKITKIKDIEFIVEGYEPYAITQLIKEGCRVEDIDTNKKLIIKYYDSVANIQRKHIPDIFIPSTNTIIEVKSTYTFIMNEEVFRLNKYKYKAAIKQGYNYRLMLFGDRGRLIQLPTFWLLYSYLSMKKWMKGKRNVRGY